MPEWLVRHRQRPGTQEEVRKKMEDVAPACIWRQEDSHCSSDWFAHRESMGSSALPGAMGPSVSTVAEARVRAPWPAEAAAIATAPVVHVATAKAVAQGAVAIASITIVQGRAQGNDAVQGGGSEGPVEVGSIARIAGEVASAAEETSHGGRS